MTGGLNERGEARRGEVEVVGCMILSCVVRRSVTQKDVFLRGVRPSAWAMAGKESVSLQGEGTLSTP